MRPVSSKLRSQALLALVFVLSVATLATIVALQHRSAASRDSEARLKRVQIALVHLQMDPFRALAVFGGQPQTARAQIAADEREIDALLSAFERQSPPPALHKLVRPVRENQAAIDQIEPISSSSTFTTRLDPRFFPLLKRAGTTSAAAYALLDEAARDYRARASRQQTQASVWSATAILLLFLAFAVVYRRAFRARRIAEELAAENAELAAVNRQDARTDALTDLRNRRALIDDLDVELAAPGGQRALLLTLFDLDGFKHYNDTFGHPAGDGLLARLGQRLQSAVDGHGTAYRIGGDEFCVLTPLEPGAAQALVERASLALSDVGDGFDIGCSFGSAWMPREARTAAEALGLADQRLYERKASRSTATRQSTDVLLKVLSERNSELREHLDGVADLATRTAERLGLPAHEVKRIGLGAELHDVGKTAIPDAILNKPGPLDDAEWRFMRRHTLIGERILLAAPSLAPTAELVRASHEAFDGTGYPDALEGEAIPLGARIIAVCDAFDAMISDRSYRAAMPTADALDELRRCAGTQFDPRVIEVFCALVADRRPVSV